MRRSTQLIMAFALGAVVTLMVAAAPQSESGSSADVIKITKAEWQANMQKNTSAAMANVDEDCTMFEPGFPTRLEGKAMIRRWTEASSNAAGNLVMAEMTNEKIQTFGNTAVLTYNFLGAEQTKDGEVKPITAKSTRVYVKERGQWWLVHANFAPVGPNN